MNEVAGLVGWLLVASSLLAGLWLVQRALPARRARQRLELDGAGEAILDYPRAERRSVSAGTLGGPGPIWPAFAAIPPVALGCLLLGWHPIPSTGIGAVAGALVHVAIAAAAQRRAIQLEEGLAEAIGLTSSALRAGAGPVDALERAAEAGRGPARSVLLDLAGRLRLGDDAEEALTGLAARVPLESFRLFSLALATQWGAGGSLERSLAVVARAVRDRVEVQRRIHTQSAPTRGSVFAFVVATGAIAFLMWQHDPVGLERFLVSSRGSTLVGVAIWLQALGIVWMWRLSRIQV